jgi:hypothetical protein
MGNVHDDAARVGERDDGEPGALTQAKAEAQISLDVAGRADLQQGRQPGRRTAGP